MFSMTNFILLE